MRACGEKWRNARASAKPIPREALVTIAVLVRMCVLRSSLSCDTCKMERPENNSTRWRILQVDRIVGIRHLRVHPQSLRQ